VDIQEIGRHGEKILREYFKSIKVEALFQADWIIFINHEYRLIEVKHQEIFSPPPFYGHGLPRWQVEARIKFYKETRIKPYLFIVEKSDYGKRSGHSLIFCQSLIALELGNYHDTFGEKPRRIYEIGLFKKIYFPAKD
jgi:hypothetical protein